ncbi:MAG: hypothetical protein ACTHLT_06955 [Devosia sp.]
MTDPHKPSRSNPPQPREVPADIPEPEERQRILPEGQIPGLPVSNDPLLQPMPRPAPREIPPID